MGLRRMLEPFSVPEKSLSAMEVHTSTISHALQFELQMEPIQEI